MVEVTERVEFVYEFDDFGFTLSLDVDLFDCHGYVEAGLCLEDLDREPICRTLSIKHSIFHHNTYPFLILLISTYIRLGSACLRMRRRAFWNSLCRRSSSSISSGSSNIRP